MRTAQAHEERLARGASANAPRRRPRSAAAADEGPTAPVLSHAERGPVASRSCAILVLVGSSRSVHRRGRVAYPTLASRPPRRARRRLDPRPSRRPRARGVAATASGSGPGPVREAARRRRLGRAGGPADQGRRGPAGAADLVAARARTRTGRRRPAPALARRSRRRPRPRRAAPSRRRTPGRGPGRRGERVGKTTTIGKLAAMLAADGHSGEPGRQRHVPRRRRRAARGLGGPRSGAHLVAQERGADPGAVAFDAVTSATARGRDVLIVDTAGRLHTKAPLMDELAKVGARDREGRRRGGRDPPGARRARPARTASRRRGRSPRRSSCRAVRADEDGRLGEGRRGARGARGAGGPRPVRRRRRGHGRPPAVRARPSPTRC